VEEITKTTSAIKTLLHTSCGRALICGTVLGAARSFFYKLVATVAENPRTSRGLILAAVTALAFVAVFAITQSFRASKTVEQSAASHGSQATSGTATNNPQPTRADTVR